MQDKISQYFQEFSSQQGSEDLADLYMKSNEGKFVRSLDGDTIDLVRGGVRQSTRFAGIDSPEMSQALGSEAETYLNSIIEKNGPVRLGSRLKDRYGRDVASLYSGKKNLNLEMVRAGFAKAAYLDGVSKKFRKQLEDAQTEAQSEGRGIWASGYGDTDFAAHRQDMKAKYGEEAGKIGHRKDDANLPASIADMYQEFRGTADTRFHYNDRKRPFEATKKVPYGSKYPKEEGWLARALGALDYVGNISRSGIDAAISGDNIFENMAQAIRKERYTDPSNLKDKATEAVGLGKVRFGKDDNSFDPGDIADFALDVATDLATDPLTWITGGLSNLAKGGKLAKLAPGASKALGEAKVGLDTVSAAKARKYLAGGKMALGGVYGLGTSEEDDGIAEKLVRVGVGVGGVGLGIKGGPWFGEKLKKGMNKATDKYMLKAYGEVAENFSEKHALAKKAFDKVKKVSEWIRQGRFEALDGLSDTEKAMVSSMMHDLKNEFTRRRNLIDKSIMTNRYRPSQMHYAGKKGKKKLYDRGSIQNKAYEDLTSSMERWKPKYIEKVLRGVEESQKNRIVRAIGKWERHNTEVIKRLNRDRWGLTGGKWKNNAGIVGIKWHIDEIFEKKEIIQLDETVGKFGIYKKTLEAQQMNKLDLDKSYAVYTENFAKTFLDDKLADAYRWMSEFSNVKPESKGIRGFHKFLKGYDKITNFMKANMLFFSMSWLKNNYWDNLTKAYIEGGYHNLIDTATLGKFQQGVSRDVWDLYGNNLNRRYKAKDLRDAFERGVLDNPLFDAMVDTDARQYLYTKEKIVEVLREKGKASALGRISDKWIDIIGPRTVGKVGSFIEGTARMTTYMRARDALMASPHTRKLGTKKIKDMAADIVSRAFFDYGDISYFENAVMKRFIPFYSFYSKNLPWWVKAMVDPEKAGRMLLPEKVRRNIGDDPSRYDLSGMTPYLSENAPRAMGIDQDGNHIYTTYPSSSQHDAIKMINWQTIMDQLIEKGHPLIKTAAEFMSGKDLFTGTALLASDQEVTRKGEKPKKFLFSRGFKYFALQQALDVMGLDAGSTFNNWLHRTKKGKPTTDSDTVVVVDKLLSTFFPMGAVDQIVGSLYKKLYTEEELKDIIMAQMLPIRNIKVSPEYHMIIRANKAKEKYPWMH